MFSQGSRVVEIHSQLLRELHFEEFYLREFGVEIFIPYELASIVHGAIDQRAQLLALCVCVCVC